MTTEFQPRERLPFYLPENWLPLDTAGGGGSYINYPTAQTANISFPGSILCSSLQSFAPTAPMNLFNNSTTGSIQIANNSGYSGGIVINSNAVAPADNTVRIGDTDRPVIMPRVRLTEVDPIGVAGVVVNSDMTIVNGKELYTNVVKPATLSAVSLPNGATTTAPATGDGSSRIVTSQWVRDQGYATTAGYVTYNGTSPFTTRQTFSGGITVESIIPPSGFDVSITNPVTTLPPIPNNSTRIPTTEWVNTTISNALAGYAQYASTTAFSVLQTFNLGIKTNSVALVSGTELTLPASTTSTPTVPDNTTRVPTTGWVNTTITNYVNALTGFAKYASTTAFTVLQTFNLGIATNSIALVSGTTLTLPASTTTAPGDADTSSRVVSSQWVRNQGYVSAISSDVTYDGVGPFTTVQTFNAGIKTTSVQGLNSTGTVSLGTGQDYGAIVRVGTTSNSIIQLQGTSVTLEGTVRSSNLTGYTTSSNLAIGTDQVAGGTITLGTTSSEITTYGTFKTDAISLVSGTSLALPASTTTTPPTSDNTTLVPTTSWVNSAITTAIAAISGFATYAGTTPFTALQTFNAGVTINSSATPLTITASGTAETYNAGGASAPTVRNFTGSTTGASGMSTTFYRRNAAGIGVANPYRIFTTSGVVTCQYMELFINGVIARSMGGNNVFSTKATFVITNASGSINISNLTYPLQYSSVGSLITISVSLSSATELRVFIDNGTGSATRQDYYATLVAYPSMGTSSATSNFTITVQSF